MTEFNMPPVSAGFAARGRWLIDRLMVDLAITENQAAGIVGNLGGESGLTAIQEVHPISGRGGFGWEQPTGPRRVAFEAFAAAHGWKTTDDQANYKFLLYELRGSEARAFAVLKKAWTVEEAVDIFQRLFERPSDPAAGLSPRIKFAQQALAGPRIVVSPPVAVPAQSTPATAPLAYLTAVLGLEKPERLLLQTALGVEADGFIGPITKAALSANRGE